MKRCCSVGGFVRLPVLWIILAAAVVAAGALVSFWRMGEADLFMREELSRQTRLLTETIPPDQIRALSGTEDDLSRPEYLRFKSNSAPPSRLFPEASSLPLSDAVRTGPYSFTPTRNCPVPGTSLLRATCTRKWIRDSCRPLKNSARLPWGPSPTGGGHGSPPGIPYQTRKPAGFLPPWLWTSAETTGRSMSAALLSCPSARGLPSRRSFSGAAFPQAPVRPPGGRTVASRGTLKRFVP